MISIALIDDDREFLSALSEYLRGRGYTVCCFYSYHEARVLMQPHVSVALIDLHLGDGDGFELAQEYKERFPHLQFIMMTGYDSLPKRLRSFGLGAEDYMKKPIFPAELEARIRRLARKGVPVTTNFPFPDEVFSRCEREVLSVLYQSLGALVPVESLETMSRTKSAVYTALSRIKQKLPYPYYVKTFYGRGWALCKYSE